MEASTADLHVVEAAPGTGKSLLLVTNAKLLGALKCLNLVYNNTTASDLRGRGAINTHMFNSILMRSLRNSVVRQLYRQGGARKRTAPGTGEDDSRPSLGLVSGQDMNKTQLLLAMMYPPAAEDGNARFSLIYRLFGEFTKELYAAALNRGWANRFRAGFPEMTDVMALMALARELNCGEPRLRGHACEGPARGMSAREVGPAVAAARRERACRQAGGTAARRTHSLRKGRQASLLEFAYDLLYF